MHAFFTPRNADIHHTHNDIHTHTHTQTHIHCINPRVRKMPSHDLQSRQKVERGSRKQRRHFSAWRDDTQLQADDRGFGAVGGNSAVWRNVMSASSLWSFTFMYCSFLFSISSTVLISLSPLSFLCFSGACGPRTPCFIDSAASAASPEQQLYLFGERW